MMNLDKNIEDLNIELKEKEDQLNNIMDNFSEKVYYKIIVPFCKKYKLTFIQGMGIYGFRNNKNILLNYKEMKTSQKQRDLETVCNLLDTMQFDINNIIMYKLEDYQ